MMWRVHPVEWTGRDRREPWATVYHVVYVTALPTRNVVDVS